MSDELTDDSEGIKNLRAQYDKLVKDKADNDKRLSELLSRDRTRTIEDKFTEYGVNKKIAKFVPSDLELDKVEEWMTDNADVFGFKLGQSDDSAHDAERQAQQRTSGFNSQTSTDENPDFNAVAAAQSGAELRALIEQAQAGRR